MPIVEKSHRIDNYSHVFLNDHIVFFGIGESYYESKCISCDKRYEFEQRVLSLTDPQFRSFKIYSLRGFLDESCMEPRESVNKVVSERVLSQYVGDVKTKDRMVEIESEVRRLLGGGSNVDIDISEI